MNRSSRALLDYYRRRAPEYERVYDKPERREELAGLEAWLREGLASRHVLELACGTGYWTKRVAPVVESLLATDGGERVLEVARAKELPPERVRFAVADAYDPARSPEVAAAAPFDAVLAAFWWSHVPRARLRSFLRTLHGVSAPGAVVCLCDNRYVEGSSTPVARVDEAGDQYQERRLADGSVHEVLKNFPDTDELKRVVAEATEGGVREIEMMEWRYFWGLRYRLPDPSRAGSLSGLRVSS